jgi:hypothetical protein
MKGKAGTDYWYPRLRQLNEADEPLISISMQIKQWNAPWASSALHYENEESKEAGNTLLRRKGKLGKRACIVGYTRRRYPYSLTRERKTSSQGNSSQSHAP